MTFRIGEVVWIAYVLTNPMPDLPTGVPNWRMCYVNGLTSYPAFRNVLAQMTRVAQVTNVTRLALHVLCASGDTASEEMPVDTANVAKLKEAGLLPCR